MNVFTNHLIIPTPVRTEIPIPNKNVMYDITPLAISPSQTLGLFDGDASSRRVYGSAHNGRRQWS
jgi:hypothetical protein